MNFLRRFRRFYTSDVKAERLSSYFKENAQTILTAATILAGVFAAGVYSVQTAAAIKVLEQKNKGQVMALEERIKTTEEKIKTAKEEAKKEALERLFNINNQSEYESSKKAIQEIPIQKNNVK
jgi:molybdopterin-guanine dinucleotide biosynthesis protein A